ncbi:dna transposase thap9 isoform x1 [Lasius niger]|uniref:Dna transposase thap9 isoform x1 n=1 Tax=Lasius niger TaxID=67767 RepID=A0A0J7K7V2_LASNI|nr:dna transposase thap9 isoform x1 [Lasius niger]
MDSTKILSVPCTRLRKIDRYDPAVYDAMVNIRVSKKYGFDSVDNESSEGHKFLSDFLDFKNKLPETLFSFSRSCVANISGWVVKKLVDEKKPIVKCKQCCDALFQSSQVRAEFENNGLVEAKTRDSMIPSEQNFPAVLCSKIMHDLLQPPCTLFSSLNEHLYDNAVGDSNHIYLLTKNVCTTLRLFAATKLAPEAAVGYKV